MKILQNSLIYRFFEVIAGFFSGQMERSAIISRFLRYPVGYRTPGLLADTVALLRDAQLRVFKRLRLDKALRGSVFTHPEFFCALTLVAGALLPTLLTIPLAAAMFGTLFLRLGSDPEYRIAPHPAMKYALLHIAVYAAGTLMSVSLRDSLYGGALLTFFACVAVGAYYSLRTKRAVYFAVYALVLGGFAVSCHGIMQYLNGVTGASAWLDKDMFSGMNRVYATLGNPNVLAEYLLLVIPFGAACVVTAKNVPARFFALCATGAMLLCMGLTLARGGWLGLIAAAAIFLVMLDRRFILLGIAGLIALYFMLPDVYIDRLMSIGNLKDGSTSYRLSIWLATITMLRDYWFVGIGPGAAAFNRVYPLYAYNASNTQHSHNLYMQLVCDCGIFGLLTFLPFMFALVRSLAQGTRKTANRTARVFRIAGISAVAGFLIQGATDYSFYNYRAALMFWAVMGLSLALSRRLPEEETV